VVKNKVAAPFQIGEFDIYYNEGISKESELLNLAIKEGIVKKSGVSFTFNEEKLGSRGIEQARKFLKEDPKIFKEIRKATIDKVNE
jgi:recombination protein RecA